MAKTVLELKKISIGYPLFEENQVLTAEQLNSITEYFETQTRLTRTALLGIGVVSGLNARYSGDLISLSKGCGVTSEGDLIVFSSERVFDRFRMYDENAPEYLPFVFEKERIALLELVAEGQTDRTAISLRQLQEKSGYAPGELVVIIYMENYISDPDLCSASGCDNLGKNSVNTLKVLLALKKSAAMLSGKIDTPAMMYKELPEIFPGRTVFTDSINTTVDFRNHYREACVKIHTQLIDNFVTHFPYSARFFGDIFPSDPSRIWITKLTKLSGEFKIDQRDDRFTKSDEGIQYYYAFLKDISETYNDFLDILFEDTALINPNQSLFPKHLLAGNLIPGTQPDENRTPFYPSVLTSNSEQYHAHAHFLLKKIDILINTFALPEIGNTEIRVTPGKSEESSSEERSIPYYYGIDEQNPVYDYWNYERYRRRMGKRNYSYNGDRYGNNANRDPLDAALGKYPFFRIEGHLGQPVAFAHAVIEKLIKEKNLPFSLRAVMLGSDKSKIVIKPPIRYNDLHRLHSMLRQDISTQMGDVQQFSTVFKANIEHAITNRIIEDNSELTDGPAITSFVDSNANRLKNNTDTVQGVMQLDYQGYRQNDAWKQHLVSAVNISGQYKSQLGNVVKTDFSTPFDTLIGSTHLQWLGWLDEIIQKKEEKEDDRLLFRTFINLHPGADHAGGVLRGGTFILLYDEQTNRVIADLMLPYYSPESAEEQDNEPVFPKLKDDFILGSGIRIQQSREKFVAQKIDSYNLSAKISLENIVTSKLQNFKETEINPMQKDYFNTLKDSFNKISDTVIAKTRIDPVVKDSGAISDPKLGVAVRNMQQKEAALTYLYDQADTQAAIPEIAAKYNEIATLVANDLDSSIQEIEQLITTSRPDVSTDSDAVIAKQVVAKGQGTLSRKRK